MHINNNLELIKKTTSQWLLIINFLNNILCPFRMSKVYIEDIIGEERRNYELTTVDDQPCIPFFGTNLPKIQELFVDTMRNCIPYDQLINEEWLCEDALRYLEFETKIASFLAKSNSDGGRILDFGCGLAIPSIAYNMLTKRASIGIDIDGRQITKASQAAKIMGTDQHFSLHAMDFLEAGSRLSIKSGDMLVALTPDNFFLDRLLETIVKYRPITLFEYTCVSFVAPEDIGEFFDNNRFSYNLFHLRMFEKPEYEDTLARTILFLAEPM
jgi:hypothetical protein